MRSKGGAGTAAPRRLDGSNTPRDLAAVVMTPGSPPDARDPWGDDGEDSFKNEDEMVALLLREDDLPGTRGCCSRRHAGTNPPTSHQGLS